MKYSVKHFSEEKFLISQEFFATYEEAIKYASSSYKDSVKSILYDQVNKKRKVYTFKN